MMSRDAKLLKVFYFIRYFGDSLFYSFFQLFLYSKGFPESRIGLILAITPITSILVNPFWNYISKDANVIRKLIRIITIIEGLLIITIGQLSMFELVAVLTCLIAIIGSPFYSLFDGFTATFTETYHMEYSKMRRIGALAYIFGCSLGGVLLNYIGYAWVFMISGFLFILCSIFISLIKPLPLEEKVKEKRNYRAILTNKEFYFYLAFYVLTFSIASLGDNFFGVFLTKERGITDSMYGQIVAAWVIVEFVTMLILARVGKKAKDLYLYGLIGLVYAIRLFVVGFNLPTMVIIGFAVLRGISMGTLLHIHLKHLVKIIKLENLTAGIFIIAIVSSIILAVGNTVCGYFIEYYGYSSVFMVLGCIVLIATLIYFGKGLLFKERNTEVLE